MKTIKDLKEFVPQVGRLEWIGMAQERMAEVVSHESAHVQVGTGLEGEHHSRSGRGKRQVTMIQAEHLPVVAALLGRDAVGPEELRRNLVISGINLQALKKTRFTIGEVEFEGTGDCHPCSRMEHNLGDGGYAAMRGHGGITTKVLKPGTIHIGDEVRIAAVSDQRPVESSV